MSQSNKLNKPDSLNIKIIIAAHKKYRMPQDDIYLPIHVGAEGKAPIGYQGDNMESPFWLLIRDRTLQEMFIQKK